jgi:small-conductance mechanosensitive channel
MDISSVISSYVSMDYVFLFGILLESYLLGRIVAPILIWIGRKITERTHSKLDDMIMSDIKGPIESFFFIVLIELSITYMPAYFAVFDKTQLGLATDLATIAFFTYLVYKIIHAVFKWYYEMGQKEYHLNVPTDLLPFFKNASQIFVIGVAVMIGLNRIGVDISAISALPLIITLVAGLGAMDIISNMFYGLAVQMERQIRYGDYLKLPSGDIVRLRKIGLKTTKLLDLSGNTILMSNAEFAKSRITKLAAAGSFAKISVPFEIESRCDLGKLQEHVKKALAQQAEVVKDPNSISITVSKYKQGWVEGSVNATIADFMFSSKINDAVTRAVKEFIGKR